MTRPTHAERAAQVDMLTPWVLFTTHATSLPRLLCRPSTIYTGSEVTWRVSDDIFHDHFLHAVDGRREMPRLPALRRRQGAFRHADTSLYRSHVDDARYAICWAFFERTGFRRQCAVC